MFIVYPQLIKKTHLAWKCHRLCTFKLSGNFPSRRILLSRNVNVPGTIGSPQPAGTYGSNKIERFIWAVA